MVIFPSPAEFTREEGKNSHFFPIDFSDQTTWTEDKIITQPATFCWILLFATHCAKCFIISLNPLRWVLLLFPVCRWGCQGLVVWQILLTVYLIIYSPFFLTDRILFLVLFCFFFREMMGFALENSSLPKATMTVVLPAFPDKLASQVETAVWPSSDQQDISSTLEIPGDDRRDMASATLLPSLSSANVRVRMTAAIFWPWEWPKNYQKASVIKLLHQWNKHGSPDLLIYKKYKDFVKSPWQRFVIHN